MVKVPEDAPLELLGPLGCGIQIIAGGVLNTLRPEAGTSIAVFGAGRRRHECDHGGCGRRVYYHHRHRRKA